MRLQPVIGLETHVQLKTKTKMFCGCSAHSEHLPPNTNVCPVCMGHPGTLPLPNQQAVHWAVLLGLALNGQITPHSKFDRKNYFYPDLPKAYQISQFDLPIMTEGEVELDDIPGEAPKTIRLERMHLEEDAAKNIHGADGKTYVDFNRGGTPLCEIVTAPVFENAAQAKAYVQELRLLVRMLGISDGDLERGHMRCDVNISLREVDDKGMPLSPVLSPKTEIKNINSFRAIERAIAYEVKRQTELWEAGNPPDKTFTRGWNDTKQITEEQRAKEDSADYRYFPDPDIPPLELASIAKDLKPRMPELPTAKRHRLKQEYGFKTEDIRMIMEDPALADFAERALSELGAWIIAKPEITADQMPEARQKLTKTFSGWLLTKLMGLLEERKSDIRTMKLSPENFAEFVSLIADNKLTGPKGLEVLGKMLDDGSDPSHVMEELGATRMDDMSALEAIVKTVIQENPKEADRYKAGDTKLIQFFVGQVMKASKGNADPSNTSQAIKNILG
ncbi:MAG: Asp-tRNA(Asn)/Glu-tRNA(Gln) amidotransferase subunit GatB [Patescibacteria group bacterium]